MYIKRKVIQKYFTDHYDQYGEETSFVDISKRLYLQKAYSLVSSDNTFVPNIVPMDDSAFFALVNETNIDIRKAVTMDNVHEDYDEEDKIIPIDRDLFAFMNFEHYEGNLRNQRYLEINYIYSGNCALRYADTSIPLTEGDFIIVGPNCIRNHENQNHLKMISISIRTSTFRDVFFPLMAEQTLLSRYFLHCLFGSSPNCLLFHMKYDNLTKAIIQNIYIESNHQSTIGYNSCAIGWLNILFAHILRNKNIDSISPIPSVNDFFFHILNFIEQNYVHLTLPELAKHFHFSVTYMSHYIHNNFGQTFITLIQDLKLAEGKKLLEKTALSIEEISSIIGYNSSDHFARMFRKENGISPHEYRKQNRKRSD